MSKPTSPRSIEILYVGDTPSDAKACEDCNVRIAAAARAPTVNLGELKETRPDLMFHRSQISSGFLRREPD